MTIKQSLHHFVNEHIKMTALNLPTIIWKPHMHHFIMSAQINLKDDAGALFKGM